MPNLTDNILSVVYLILTLAVSVFSVCSFAFGTNFCVVLIIVIVFLAATFYLVTHYIKFQTCTYKRITMVIPNLPDSLKGKKIAIASDFHMDKKRSCITDRLLEESVNLMTSMSPDAIFLLGDFLDNEHTAVSDMYASFDKLSAICPVLGIYGNHDYVGGNPSLLNDKFQAHGVTIVPNGYAVKLFNKIDVVGIDDLEQVTYNPSVLSSYCQHNRVNDGEYNPIFVITHNPESTDHIKNYPVDAIFAGHTHGGQICVPSGTPLLKFWAKIPNAFWWSDKMRARMEAVCNMKYIYGWYSEQCSTNPDKKIQVLVSSGVGSHMGLRACCEPEVILVTLA
ncbi:hypothetical protein EIN_410580 [Entamoeba invadens IP1]|uniref:Calcineurin-like phosphoesterase domain-containing protein n=2 Tax=Entamoeba invadens TaxID=33085 RepID=A0A0A1U139_ENTIV|nr:hypothetical protein EIN_410580 [Entamoeba invadens IP1]ELP87725.1 hypothetical protein EIN_410580 [Entamoeba invadens IP1]BAN41549.1 hypothetical protein, conserved [Entamoeba invadens]|eukprot:XP_004254496.1 hypothetical protein EIN_410580 [Entamoeba invadens IP1]